MIARIIAGSIIALGLGLMTENAQAAQTFMCDDGRLLEVESNQLERLKRTDPCIAAYYGLEVRTVPLPVKRPPPRVQHVLKGSRAPATSRRDIGAVAQAGSSYRKVRIINAPRGRRAWFIHSR